MIRRFSMLLAAGCALLALCACNGTVPANTALQNIAAAQAKIANACEVFGPTLKSLQTMDASATPAEQTLVNALVTDSGKLCAANAALDASTLSSLVNTSIPQAITAVGEIPALSSKAQGIQFALLAFQTAISAALAQYNSAVPAAIPTAASAPLVA
jgi:hypothetical protein